MGRQKKAARAVQRYTGARYTTCLRWVRILDDEGLIGKNETESSLRVALHHRFPEIEVQRDKEG